MKTLSKFEFSAWKDGERLACSLHANIEGSKLGYISFYFGKGEFEEFCSEFCSVNDLSHNLRATGDLATFYDLNFDTAPHGETTVKYVNVNFPLFVRKILLRWAQKQWKSEENHMQRPKITVSDEKLARWKKNYGRCTGKVNLIIPDDHKEFFEQCNVSESFKTNVERLLTIGHGYTTRFYQTVNCHLSKDWDGFYFHYGQIMFRGQPKRIGLNGGLVNHGKEKPDWSIHT